MHALFTSVILYTNHKRNDGHNTGKIFKKVISIARINLNRVWLDMFNFFRINSLFLMKNYSKITELFYRWLWPNILSILNCLFQNFVEFLFILHSMELNFSQRSASFVARQPSYTNMSVFPSNIICHINSAKNVRYNEKYLIYCLSRYQYNTFHLTRNIFPIKNITKEDRHSKFEETITAA